jgi:hypothetical protein
MLPRVGPSAQRRRVWQPIPKQSLHTAGDKCFVEEHLSGFLIVPDEVVEIFDLVAQRVIDRFWIELAGISYSLKHFALQPLVFYKCNCYLSSYLRCNHQSTGWRARAHLQRRRDGSATEGIAQFIWRLEEDAPRAGAQTGLAL